MKFSGTVVFMTLWSLCVYAPLAHMVWGKGGLLNATLGGRFPTLDFAGGTVVHITSGVSALVCALYLGKRTGYPKEPMPPHSLVLSFIARASEVVLRVVPGSLREASFGLGASRWRTVWHVVLPTARPGLATALILAVARGIGETSPVLIASGYATFLVTHPMRGVMSSLPLSVFNSVIAPEPQAVVRGYATAAVLLILVLILFVIARLLARPPSRQAAAAATASGAPCCPHAVRRRRPPPLSLP